MKQSRNDSADSERRARAGVSRKQFLVRGAVATGAAAGLASGLRPIRGGTSAADASIADEATTGAVSTVAGSLASPLALVNGRIHTMDEDARVVSSVLIENGRFAQVGRKVRARSGVRVIDLRGRTVIPGMIDSHVHIIAAGLRPGYATPLERAFSIADVQRIYAARRPSVPEGGWITSIGGYRPMQFEENRLPVLKELDEAVPDRPVFMFIGFTGPAVTNTLGKKFFESKGIPVGDDGLVGGSEAVDDGPTGIVGPSAALMAFRHLEDLKTFEDVQRNTLTWLNFAASTGLTTALDQAVSLGSTVPKAQMVGGFIYTSPTDGLAHMPDDDREVYLPILAVHREGKMPMRVRTNFMHGERDPNMPNLKGRLMMAWPFFGDDMLKTGGIGEFTTDGSTGVTTPTPQWLESQRLVAEAGWRNENHSVVPPDYQGIIAGWELVNSETSIEDLRWVLAHPASIEREWVLRLKALGAGTNLGAAIPHMNNSAGPSFRMVLDTGIPVSICSDGAGSIAGLNPFMSTAYAVSGRDIRGKLKNDGQQLSRQEALNLQTRAASWFIHEDDIGSIEVGHHADLLVLNKDYFSESAVPDDQIKHVGPVMTVVGGRVVYDAGKLGSGRRR